MAWSLTSSGLVAPASPSVSGDVNTMDDYEEGTFTPTLSSVNVTGSGAYTLIGKHCFLLMFASPTDTTGTTGGVNLGAWPFTIKGEGYNYANHHLMVDNLNTAAGAHGLQPNIGTTAGVILINVNNTTTQHSGIQANHLTTSTDVRCGLQYWIDF